jgi:hypothetical protein
MSERSPNFSRGLDSLGGQDELSKHDESSKISQCDQGAGDSKNPASDFLDFAAEILARSGPQTDGASSRIRETESLGRWIAGDKRLIAPESIDSLSLVSNSTSEHEVFYRPLDNRAVKRTWPGIYGQIPVPSNGRLDRANASPSQYLLRQALHISVFGSDIRFEGVCVSNKPSMVLFEPAGQPSLVISQEWFESGEAPEMSEIARSLRADGFESVPNSYFGWYRASDGVVVVDAKPDNFVKTPLGVVPIDLQMAVFSPEEARLAGLLNS